MMAIGGSRVIGQSTCEQLWMLPEGRESILERGDDALYDSYHSAQPQVHQQQEGNDGPEGGSRKQRDDITECHNDHTWTDHNLWMKGRMVRALSSVWGALTPFPSSPLKNYL